MTQQDLKPGMVIRFQYELKGYKGKWMQHVGILVKQNTRSIWVYCLHNGHNCVFTANEDGTGLRNFQQLPWSLQNE